MAQEEPGGEQVLQTDHSILTARMAEDEKKEYDLENPQHLLDFLIDANIRLVRYEYLLHLQRENRIWPRRQEAENETFVDEDGSVKTALVTLEEYKDARNGEGIWWDISGKSLCILSVSHCWEAKQHPDPFCFQAQGLPGDWKSSKALHGKELHGDFLSWIFVDFLCLPQYYRTPEEQVFFKRAMANMHVLYAHRCIGMVFRLEDLTDESAKAFPPDFIDIYYEEAGAEPGSGKFGPQPFNKLEFNDTPYHERGWCVAEIQWMCTKTRIKGFAPMTPAMFRERVERGRRELPGGVILKFTHRSDEEIVVELQEKIFLQQAPARKTLVANGLGQLELLVLAGSLPYFVNLETLIFEDSELGEASAVALIAGLKPLRHLKELLFRNQCCLDEEAAKIVARGLFECPFAQDFTVELWKDPETEQLMNELRLFKRTGQVEERSEDQRVFFAIKDAGQLGWFAQQVAKLGRCCQRRSKTSPLASHEHP